MKIGIKYCGGCNPRYDRLALVEKIKNRYIKESIEVVKVNETYDTIFVVCGCPSSCANHIGLICEKKIIITKIDDFDEFTK